MHLRAYAKINLTLEVLGRRNDGYHEVVTILQNVGLYDVLHIEPAPSMYLTCSADRLEGEDNLVWRAAARLRAVASVGDGARIHLEKHIPAAMGLGGGSSDAAAALVGLSTIWDLSLSARQVASIAAELGSDVPFFLVGGTAKAEGRGEQVSPIPAIPQRWVLLLCPDIDPSIESGGKTGAVVPQPVDGQLLRRVGVRCCGQCYPRGTVSVRLPVEHLRQCGRTGIRWCCQRNGGDAASWGLRGAPVWQRPRSLRSLRV